VPNPIKGEVPLKLSDGREFTLVLDMEALVEAEAAYGKPLAQVMADASAGFVGASRALLYGAMRAHHPSVTLREASALFMQHGEAVSETLTAAADAAMPASAEGNVGKPPRGQTSGGSGAKPAKPKNASGGKRRARSG
jgi:hypothetical protein